MVYAFIDSVIYWVKKILTELPITSEDESLFQYFKTLTEKATLSFGGGSHLGVPCRASCLGLFGRIEWDGETTSTSQHPIDPCMS